MTTHRTVPSPSPVEAPWRLPALLPRIAVRVAGLVGVDLALSAAAARDTFGTDPVGTGLAVLLLIALVAVTWGALDGYRYRHRFGLAAASWLVAAPLAGLGMQLVHSVDVRTSDPTYDVAQVAADLVTGVPFLAGLVLVPALLATACLALVTRSLR